MAQTMRHLTIFIDFVPLKWHDLVRHIAGHCGNKIPRSVKLALHFSCTVYDVQYSDWETSSDNLASASRRSLFDFMADAFYVAPITELALLHSAASPLPPSSAMTGTFFYVFNYSTDVSSSDTLAYSLGAALTDGIDPFSTDVIYSPADKLLSEIVLNYWTNFVRTG